MPFFDICSPVFVFDLPTPRRCLAVGAFLSTKSWIAEKTALPKIK